MKKIFFMTLLAVMICGCNEKKSGVVGSSEVDSLSLLTRENEQLRNEQEELLSTLNEIEDGFREITEAQGRLTIDRRGEGADARERIKENMQYIQQTMAQNAELIEKLQARAKESGRKNEQLQRTIQNLMAQMEQKTVEIEQLRQELESKNIRITELEQQAVNLNQNIDNLQQQTHEQNQTISQQDRQLNTAWYALGSKKELKDHNILKSGKVLQDGFDASFFTEIDIRRVNRLNLNSKKAEILTTHPTGSYNLERDGNKIYTLQILDPQQFWSTSKYLVVQVK
jgi:DNA repair exonuclease SbcCD ATPase subunit